MNQQPSCDKDFVLQKLSDFFEIFKAYVKKEKEEKGKERKEKREKGISLIYVTKVIIL